jgi:hypothetical protein
MCSRASRVPRATDTADGCAVNGALVCFMGAHAHRVGRLHAALGQSKPAQDWLQRALGTHVTLGARAWEAETCAALVAVDGTGAEGYAARARAIATELGLAGLAARMGARLDGTPVAGSGPSLRRVGDMWEVGYAGRTAYVRDVKACTTSPHCWPGLASSWRHRPCWGYRRPAPAGG